MKRNTATVQSFKILSVCLLFLISGCGGMTIKHVNPEEPNVLESNERVVFGKVLFVTHSGEMGEVRFAPVGLGLVHMATGRRARESKMYERAVMHDPLSGKPATRELSSRKPWFEEDGTFFWVLPAGNYHIDALAWVAPAKVSAQDLLKPKTEQVFSLRPENPPECGFAVCPNMGFDVSGDGGALYIGSLFIDADIEMTNGIEVKHINRAEVRDEYSEALELLKSRCPSCGFTVEKRLMTSIPDRPVSVANRRCPTTAELLFRALMGIAIQFGPSFIPVGPGISGINLGGGGWFGK